MELEDLDILRPFIIETMGSQSDMKTHLTDSLIKEAVPSKSLCLLLKATKDLKRSETRWWG